MIDLPQTVRSPGLNGIQLFEWGLHDRNFRISSDPPQLLDELRRRYGDHPVEACDLHGGSLAGYRRLLDGLLRGARQKTAMLLDLLGREDWDLFACAFGETHCVGHQFWHFMDRRHPHRPAAAPADLQEAIRSVYRAVDRGIGALVAAAGAEATVLLVASHGMGPKTGGPNLLPEVLVRLGMSSGRGGGTAYGLRRFRQAQGKLAEAVQKALKPVADSPPVRALRTRSGALRDPLVSPATRAVDLLNNRCGAIRLNLRGREPHGSVEPGAEAEALLEELRRALLALEEPASGQRIVDRVVTAAEAFGPDRHPDVPDLMVVFRTDLGPLERCRSPRTGLVHEPLARGPYRRTGDHTMESRLWGRGPGIAPGRRLPDGNVLDLAPTVLRLLDLPLPNRLDGAPIPLRR